MPTKQHKKNSDRVGTGGERLLLRAKTSDRIRKAAISAVRKTITNRLKSEHASMKQEMELIAAASAPLHSLLEKDPKAFAAQRKLSKKFDAGRVFRMKAFKKRPMPISTFEIQVNPGLEIIVPPYDLEWHLAFSQADKKNGTFAANGAFIGYEAAGVGVILSSPVRAALSFRPIAPFKYLWVNSPGTASSSTRGGLGVLAYRNNDAEPFLDRQRVLWDERRSYPSLGNQGDGGGFFAQEFFPNGVLLQVEAGDTFRIWIWCWCAQSVARSGEFSLPTGHIECQVPFIVVDAGPPLPPVK